MATWITLYDLGKEKHIKLDSPLSEMSMYLGTDNFKILKLISGDFMFVRDDYKDYTNLEINETASLLRKEPIYGDVVILDSEEFLG